MKWLPALLQLILELLKFWKAKEREAINEGAERDHKAINDDLNGYLRNNGMLVDKTSSGDADSDVSAPPKDRI